MGDSRRIGTSDPISGFLRSGLYDWSRTERIINQSLVLRATGRPCDNRHSAGKRQSTGRTLAS